MRKTAMRWLSIATVFVSALVYGLGATGDAQEPLSKFRPNAAGIPNRYIVVLHDTAAGPKGLSSRAPALAQQLAAVHRGRLTQIYQHAINGFAIELSEEAARALSEDPRVAFIEQDVRGRLDTTQFNPPSWGLDRIDQQSNKLNAQYRYDFTGAGVNAYVMDGGIRTTHIDFNGRASVGADFVGDGRNGQDCNGHGTHVAGTIGGELYGVAKDVNLIAVRMMNCIGEGDLSWGLAAVDWIRNNRGSTPSVVNMSLSYPAASGALDTAVRNLVASGVTFVAAAGNDGITVPDQSPKRVGEVILVGSTGTGDFRSAFSNFGSWVDLFAPGENIVSAGILHDGEEVTRSGTSMATPHVAGAAALYLQTNPTASPGVVAHAIISTAATNKLFNIGAGSPNRLLYTGPPPMQCFPCTTLQNACRADGGTPGLRSCSPTTATVTCAHRPNSHPRLFSLECGNGQYEQLPSTATCTMTCPFPQ